MPLVIPFKPSNPNYRLAITVDGEPYNLDVRWNERVRIDPETGEALGGWFFDVLDQEEQHIIDGIAVALGAHMGRTTEHPLFTQGVFVAVDTQKTERDAGLDDLGARVQVRYYTTFEYAARLAESRDRRLL